MPALLRHSIRSFNLFHEIRRRRSMLSLMCVALVQWPNNATHFLYKMNLRLDLYPRDTLKQMWWKIHLVSHILSIMLWSFFRLSPPIYACLKKKGTLWVFGESLVYVFYFLALANFPKSTSPRCPSRQAEWCQCSSSQNLKKKSFKKGLEGEYPEYPWTFPFHL